MFLSTEKLSATCVFSPDFSSGSDILNTGLSPVVIASPYWFVTTNVGLEPVPQYALPPNVLFGAIAIFVGLHVYSVIGLLFALNTTLDTVGFASETVKAVLGSPSLFVSV